MVKVNYLPNDDVLKKLLKPLWVKDIFVQTIYLLIMVIFGWLLFDVDDAINLGIVLAGVFYYALRLYDIIKYYVRAPKRFFHHLNELEFILNENDLVITYRFSDGQSIHNKSLYAITWVIYSNEGLLISTGTSTYFVHAGKFSEGSFEDIITVFKQYPTIKLKSV